MKYIGIDIGGTWIKGTLVDNYSFSGEKNKIDQGFEVKKVKSPLHEDTKVAEVMEALTELFSMFKVNLENIMGIGISTPGIVDYHGLRLVSAGPHLNVLKNLQWKSELKSKFQCPVSLINDADAAAIGLAERGYLNGNKTYGVMPIGTGLGFSIWRNGRRWRPGKVLPLLGEIGFADVKYNYLASASRLAGLDNKNDLARVLKLDQYYSKREIYLKNLASIIHTAAVLYDLDEVILCGGLVDAARDAGFNLITEIGRHLSNPFKVFNKTVHVRIAKEGNNLQLIGNLALAQGELVAAKYKVNYEYGALETETPYESGFRPEKMNSAEIINKLWEAEQEAGLQMEKSLSVIASIVDKCVAKIENGGRIIYVGAGTSGRVAAMDAVEIPCTYGFPEDRIVTLIAGGISDAAFEIESDFEEDASAVPELLLLNIKTNDVVIGISASGSAYYVQSALAMAKAKGALTTMMQVNPPADGLPFCDHVIPLNSGRELIGGSTRMKAGTATKKALNFFSSTLMIKLGKVIGSHMVDVVCTNDKLVERAQGILKSLYDIEGNEAMDRLKKANMHLGDVIKDLN
ncbi:N-acetylmuramic acid 6-phosphate etherase [Zobellia uliginosa]|uniref:N-acetylmuramic acid 6-phosphate etherase n=1 Tax=Zobellia uliginosa TaxID=143224 RepID=UPI0026E34C43|nr:N-acetylmuramic acid 6-phosphate etherase [Zobellia uliginosa]MDO6516520.1 N-acetylmuramic acid 6-phosphate etherase [Zobellia uliginosa]